MTNTSRNQIVKMNESSRSINRITPQISLIMRRMGKDGLYLQRLRVENTGKKGWEMDGSWTVIADV